MSDNSNKTLSGALSVFQSTYEAPKKTESVEYYAKGKKVAYSWAPLGSIYACIGKYGAPLGLSTSVGFDMFEMAGKIFIKAIVTIKHESGEEMKVEGIPLSPSNYGAQEMGSVRTYAERYALSSAWGIATEDDDDGIGASDGMSQEQPNEQRGQKHQKSEPQQQTPQQPAQPLFKDFVKERYAEIKQLVPAWDNEKINELLKEKGRVDDLRNLSQSQMIGLLKETINEIKAHQNNSTQQKVAWGQ